MKLQILLIKAGFDHTCLAAANVDSALKKEWKYIGKEVIRYVTRDPKNSSDESHEE